MKTKQFNKKLLALSVLSLLIYAWVLGVFGLYGAAITPFIRDVSLVIVKYGAIAFGFIFLAILPFRIEAAKARNKQNAEEYAAKLALMQKQVEEAKLSKLAKKLEETQNYE